MLSQGSWRGCEAWLPWLNRPSGDLFAASGRWPGTLEEAREMVRPEGFEPPTNGFGSHYSIRLSYERMIAA